MIGIVLVVIAVAGLVYASTYTRRAVTREFDEVNAQTMEMARQWGTVPKWVSLVALGSYAVLAVGLLLVIFG